MGAAKKEVRKANFLYLLIILIVIGIGIYERMDKMKYDNYLEDSEIISEDIEMENSDVID